MLNYFSSFCEFAAFDFDAAFEALPQVIAALAIVSETSKGAPFLPGRSRVPFTNCFLVSVLHPLDGITIHNLKVTKGYHELLLHTECFDCVN